jgi:hypothetical protein
VDNHPDSDTFPLTMKCETSNGILTFVLGVLVVFAVVFAVRMAFITRELRAWQRQAVIAQAVMTQTQGLYNDAVAYNQKNYDPALARILQGAQARPAAR